MIKTIDERNPRAGEVIKEDEKLTKKKKKTIDERN